MKSKRSAFRFPIPQQKVKYRTAYEEGEASLLNISTNGCAFNSVTVPLSLNEKILLIIEIENTKEYIEAKSLVVWVDGDVFGIKFTVLELDTQVLIRKYFSQMYRKSK